MRAVANPSFPFHATAYTNSLLQNGGPVYGPEFGCAKCTGSAGANNFPLRGGKHSNFEGGVRSNAFVSGGLVPAAMRGKALDGLIGIEDWCKLKSYSKNQRAPKISPQTP